MTEQEIFDGFVEQFKHYTGAHAFAIDFLIERVQKLQEVNADLLKACEAAQTLIEDMSRFAGQMALKDYMLFNEAPIALKRAVAKAKGEL